MHCFLSTLFFFYLDESIVFDFQETTLDTVEHHVPEVELHGNPSSFAVFTSVRQSMLEDHIKKISRIYLNATRTKCQDSDSEDEADVERSADTVTKIPKVCSQL